MALSKKRETFIKEYLIDKNATRAAKAAGYSEKTARSQGQRLLTKADIKQQISIELKNQAKRLNLKADHVLRELLRIATSDVGKAFDEMGQLKPLREIPKDVRRAISFIEVHELFDGRGDEKTVIGLAKKIKFWDKPKALELLAKHLKLLTEQIDHTTKGNEIQASPVIVLPANGSEADIDQK